MANPSINGTKGTITTHDPDAFSNYTVTETVTKMQLWINENSSATTSTNALGDNPTPNPNAELSAAGLGALGGVLCAAGSILGAIRPSDVSSKILYRLTIANLTPYIIHLIKVGSADENCMYVSNPVNFLMPKSNQVLGLISPDDHTFESADPMKLSFCICDAEGNNCGIIITMEDKDGKSVGMHSVSGSDFGGEILPLSATENVLDLVTNEFWVDGSSNNPSFGVCGAISSTNAGRDFNITFTARA